MGFRLQHMVEAVVAELTPPGQEIDVQLHDELPSRAPGCPAPLRNALTSLIGGAVRHTPSGDVRLRVDHLARVDGVLVVRCEVRDTSPSRAADDSQRLFELFDAASHCKGASWLLVDAPAGGTVGASRDPVVGGRFWFTARLAA